MIAEPLGQRKPNAISLRYVSKIDVKVSIDLQEKFDYKISHRIISQQNE